MLNFVESFFFASNEIIIWFVFLIWLMCCVTLIDLYILKNPCILRIKSHLIMVYDPFNVLLDSDCEYFVEDFYICVHQWNWPVIFFYRGIFIWFWHQGGAGLIEGVLEYYFLCIFLEWFPKDRCWLFFKCFIEFAYEAIWSWTFVGSF